MNLAGAVVSVGLVIGVGVWGYKLVMRDVSGIPVVRAMEGEMRRAPENPGGEIAAHTGLSVNAVAAEGGAADPEDRLVLAPPQPELPREDLEIAPAAEVAEVAPAADPLESETVVALETGEEAGPAEEPTEVATVADTRDPDQPLSAEDVLALADQIAAGAEPLSDLADGEDAPVQVSVNGVNLDDIPDVNVIDPNIPGVTRSLRPSIRPERAPVVAASLTQSAETAPEAAEAANPATTAPELTGSLPAGTKLVQLGAYDSPELAAQEWTRFMGRFPEYLDGKERVIQQAQSGGRTFYRLRAMGFADLSDARRLCSALVAQNADCIPVVVR